MFATVLVAAAALVMALVIGAVFSPTVSPARWGSLPNPGGDFNGGPPPEEHLA